MRKIALLLMVVWAIGALAAVTAAQRSSQVHEVSDFGIVAPRVVKEVKPHYTAEAMQARIEGEVVLDAVVREDGDVGNVRVSRSLDAKYGLDEEAVKAVKQWQFKPGTKAGKAVAVRVDIEIRFTLK